MIRVIEDLFLLETPNSLYAFSVLPSGHLEHLHYGSKFKVTCSEPLRRKSTFLPGNTIAYDSDVPGLALENICLEMSALGKGDIRPPFVRVTFPSGNQTVDFLYQSHLVKPGKPEFEALPGSKSDEMACETLTVTLKDRDSDLYLELDYYVYQDLDVIGRSSRLINRTGSEVVLNQLMSMQLDLDAQNYEKVSFTGAWAREMGKTVEHVTSGTLHHESLTGVSSSRVNPFFVVQESGAGDSYGKCYGFNLIYSGNHAHSVHADGFRQTRILSGLSPTHFQWVLKPEAEFQSPEALMTFSDSGAETISQTMHAFVNTHIVEKRWQNKVRPILINSWEANYFDFSEKKLLKLAKKAHEIGIELFVLDDGWFGLRNDDTSSLGDWTVNLKKLPNGLKGLSEKIHDMGMAFGIWMEPEMISEDSDLYRNHPEWAVRVPNRHHALGRHQMLLDLSVPEVCDFVVESVASVLDSCKIEYLKWDMNRIVSDAFSQLGVANESGAFAHRYVLGLYTILNRLTQKYPEVLFEGCASGGNRFDLGILCYMPQIWASDNTDAISRLDIQDGYSYGYPVSTIGAHVSDVPNHQTLRLTPLETRFNVGVFGLLGYECNLVDFDSAQLKAIEQQIHLYKKWREVLQFGTFYRIHQKHVMGWMMVSKDQNRAVAGVFQKLVTPNTSNLIFKGKGLKPEASYRFYNIPNPINVKRFGDLINMVSPVHVKNNSFVQDVVSKVYKMTGETEDYTVSGGLIMESGIRLKQGFMGMGFNETIRLFQDFDSRLYFMEADNDAR